MPSRSLSAGTCHSITVTLTGGCAQTGYLRF